MTPLPVCLIVFDFDGTICDSAGIKDEAYRMLYLEEEGEEFADAVQAYHLANAGVSRFDKIAHIERTMLGRPCPPERLAEVAARFGAIVEDQVVAAPMIAGAGPFLEQHAGEAVFTVASATPTDELRRIVRRRGIEGHFAAVDGSPDSKAAIIRRHLGQFDVDAADALMVGDQMSDYRAAVEAGVGFIGVGREAPMLEATLATIDDLRALTTAVRGVVG